MCHIASVLVRSKIETRPVVTLSGVFLPRDATHSAVMPWQVFCLSVCPSVTIRYHYHISWNTSKINLCLK